MLFNAGTVSFQEGRMYKVSVMYANRSGARLDHADHRDRNMPMVAEKLGAELKRYTVRGAGLSG